MVERGGIYITSFGKQIPIISTVKVIKLERNTHIPFFFMSYICKGK